MPITKTPNLCFPQKLTTVNTTPHTHTHTPQISCCAKQEEVFYAEVRGSTPIPVPGNCTLPVECTKTERLDMTKILLQN